MKPNVGRLSLMMFLQYMVWGAWLPLAARYLTEPDTVLIDDGTYFVHEAGGELVACGGWSRRDKLYTGSGDADGDARPLDPATEPARVRAMFVRADWTRRGLGRRILEECERAAGREGFRKLALVSTMPGLPLYHFMGKAKADELEGKASGRIKYTDSSLQPGGELADRRVSQDFNNLLFSHALKDT